MHLFMNVAASNSKRPLSGDVMANVQRRRRVPNPNQLSFGDFAPIFPLVSPLKEVLAAMDEPATFHPRNYRITDADLIGEKSSIKQKFAQNIEAIALLKKVEQEGREATPEEKSVLVKYSGWGGLPQAFDEYNDDWEKECKKLQELLTEEEYESAEGSTPNAFYTSPQVIKFIYDVLLRMGFRGGRILDPCMGVGHFFGMLPESVLPTCRLSGVELDSLSGRMSKVLYPDADIRIAGFEDTRYPDNFFDLAISNVPFGDYKVADPRYERLKLSVHDYFYAKAMDIVKPGGIVAFITSMFTLDKEKSYFRKYLYDRADLIGAVRLPNTAFKAIANTSVTSDVIVLRKRELAPGLIPGSNAWLGRKRYTISKGIEAEVNEYFVDNPHMMLGKLAMGSGPHGRPEVTLDPSMRPLADDLEKVASYFPEALLKDTTVHVASADEAFLPAPDYVKDGAFVVIEGTLYRSEAGELIPSELSAGKAKRVEGLIKIRDAAKELLCDQMISTEESSGEMRRLHLNAIYDRFVASHGYINSRENRAAFSEDPDYPLLLSLEIYDEDTHKATKAGIFTERVIHPEKRVEHVDTPQEALLVCLNEVSRIDFPRMSELTGMSEATLQKELRAFIFLNPDGGKWEPADQYLSGNVRQKLLAAQAAAAIDPQFEKNVEALVTVQPAPLDFSEISVGLGSSWLPTEDVKRFVEELLGHKDCVEDVGYSAVIGAWTVDLVPREKYTVESSVENTKIWGTSRYGAVDLIVAALNLKIPTVKDINVDGKLIVNPTETEAAREKMFAIKEKFKEWVWEELERRERLTKLYNELFNNLRARTYDGSHLTLPGMTTQVTLRPHQKDSVWRIVQTGNTLLAQFVGSGKTYIKCAAAMERKRLGVSSKPMLAVPNHLLEQWGAEFLRLYPLANVLLASKDDCTPVKRKKLMAKIAVNNWDAVIITHSSFEKLAMSKGAIAEFMQKRIDELEEAIRASLGGRTIAG